MSPLSDINVHDTDADFDRWPLIDGDKPAKRARADDYTVVGPREVAPCPSVVEIDAYTQRRFFNALARSKSVLFACEQAYIPHRLFMRLRLNNPEFSRMVDEAVDSPDIYVDMADEQVTMLARSELIKRMQPRLKRHAQVSYRKEWRDGEDGGPPEEVEIEATTETYTEVEPDLKAIEFWLINKTDGEFHRAPKTAKKQIKPVQGMEVKVPQQFLDQTGSPNPICKGVEIDLNLGGEDEPEG